MSTRSTILLLVLLKVSESIIATMAVVNRPPFSTKTEIESPRVVCYCSLVSILGGIITYVRVRLLRHRPDLTSARHGVSAPMIMVDLSPWTHEIALRVRTELLSAETTGTLRASLLIGGKLQRTTYMKLLCVRQGVF